MDWVTFFIRTNNVLLFINSKKEEIECVILGKIGRCVILWGSINMNLIRHSIIVIS